LWPPADSPISKVEIKSNASRHREKSYGITVKRVKGGASCLAEPTKVQIEGRRKNALPCNLGKGPPRKPGRWILPKPTNWEAQQGRCGKGPAVPFLKLKYGAERADVQKTGA